MRRFAVVVNDCAAPAVPGIHQIRSRDTDYGQRNFTLRFDELAEDDLAEMMREANPTFDEGWIETRTVTEWRRSE